MIEFGSSSGLRQHWTAPRVSMLSAAGLPAGARVDIVGIGVQKAATTWIFRSLIDHPEIRPSRLNGKPRKEINFFNHEYEKGYDWYHRGFEFGPWKTAEFSVLYFHDRNVPERLRRYKPDARLVLSLRDPVDRAWSHHRHEIARGRWSPERGDFWEALSRNPAYVEVGMYAAHLTRWLRHFDLEQIHVVDYERIVSEPGLVARELYEFVGVESSFRPSMLTKRIYASTVPARPAVDRVRRLSSRLFRGLFGSRIANMLRATAVGAYIRHGNQIELAEEAAPGESDRIRLAGLFRDDVARLEQMVGRTFAHWSQ